MNNAWQSIFFNALIARIQAKVPEIRFIDFDMGQIDFYDYESGERPPITYPALLIDLDNGKSDDVGDFEQEVEQDVSLRLVVDSYTKTANIVPLNYRNKALGYFDLEMKLHQALHNWQPLYNNEPICQTLSRRSFVTERREDTLRVRRIVYTTKYEDASASPEWQRVAAALSVTQG